MFYQKLDHSSDASRGLDDEASYIVEEYNSEDEASGNTATTDPSSSNGLSTKNFNLLNKYTFSSHCIGT